MGHRKHPKGQRSKTIKMWRHLDLWTTKLISDPNTLYVLVPFKISHLYSPLIVERGTELALPGGGTIIKN